MMQSVRFMPVSMFGAVMGLAGLTEVWRSFQVQWGLPAIASELWAALALLAFAAIALAYLIKFVRYPDACRAEWTNPAQSGFFGCIPIALALIAGCLLPYSAAVARAWWWVAVVIIVIIQIAIFARWLGGGMTLDQANTGWMIAVVGPVPIAPLGIALGEIEAARFIFGTGAVASLFIVGAVFHRTFFSAPLPSGMRPTLFVLIVPFALIYAYGPPLWGIAHYPGFASLFDFAVVLTAALLVFAAPLWRWPFTPAWWAFTFPLDAFALAALVHAADQPSPLAHSIAIGAVALATAAAAIVLIRTVSAVRAGRMFVPPAPAPAQVVPATPSQGATA